MSGSILDADMTTIARQLRGGWRWWIGELAAATPARLRRREPQTLRGWVLRLDRDPPAITNEGGPARPTPGTAATALLPRSAYLARTIALPALSDKDIERLLDIQIGRLMPFPAGAGLTDVTIGPPLQGMREALLATLPIETAVEAEAAIRDAGFEPAAILAPDADGVPRHDFLPVLRRARGEPDRAAPRRIWWRIVAALLLLNLILYVATDILSLRNLERLVEAHGTAADGARRARRRVLDEEESRAVLQSARTVHDPLAVVGDISRRLPEGARIDRLTIGADGIRIAGIRRGDADVLAAMRAGSRYPDVRSATTDALAETPLGQPFDVAFGWPNGRR